MTYKKTKKYFVGIDSDGTVFDSMKIKHTDSFIPAFGNLMKRQRIDLPKLRKESICIL